MVLSRERLTVNVETPNSECGFIYSSLLSTSSSSRPCQICILLDCTFQAVLQAKARRCFTSSLFRLSDDIQIVPEDLHSESTPSRSHKAKLWVSTKLLNWVVKNSWSVMNLDIFACNHIFITISSYLRFLIVYRIIYTIDNTKGISTDRDGFPLHSLR